MSFRLEWFFVSNLREKSYGYYGLLRFVTNRNRVKEWRFVTVCYGVSIDTVNRNYRNYPVTVLAGTGEGQNTGGGKGKSQDNPSSYCPSFREESQP